MAEYHNQGKLRFWCQMVLPLVYDDSLSYMELLNKVVNYLNNCIQDVGNCETNIESLLEAFVNLQDYVNELVEDLSPEIEAVIDQMIEDGDFTEIMADALNGVLAEEYDPDKSGGYLELDYVMHDGKLYACTSSTSGDWDSTKWRECTVGDELNNLMTRVYGLNAGQVSYDGTATYNSGTVGKALKDVIADVDGLTANDVAYNQSTTYDNSTVGKELSDLNTAIGDISNLPSGSTDLVDAVGDLNTALNSVEDALAIVANGNTHIAITKGEYVYVKNHSTLSEGLYIAKSNISANDTLTTSNLSALSNGGFNLLSLPTRKEYFSEALTAATETSMGTVTLDAGKWLIFTFTQVSTSDDMTIYNKIAYSGGQRSYRGNGKNGGGHIGELLIDISATDTITFSGYSPIATTMVTAVDIIKIG